ncbi:MAG: glycoside hydrolase family 88 protein [Verrucomicrobiae bacterium]|nr:glycoside hydrolase family 88 protein [Verrucomicrobiae bacterium]
MRINYQLNPGALRKKIDRLWELSEEKILEIESLYDHSKGPPVFTERGRFVPREWADWTRGFQYGSALLQFDATGDARFLELGRSRTLERMLSHLTHLGADDHGFNNVSTFGTLLRLMGEGRVPEAPWERRFYELAMRVSGAVQASRWSTVSDGTGFIHSLNGPHSLFADTIRSCRALALAHQLGQRLLTEGDVSISLLERLLQHARNTARHNVYFGEGRDLYDVRGRVAHESIFNTKDGRYRCPSTQQGYSPFSTWTRGLGWVMLGFAELLEFIESLPDAELAGFGGKREVAREFLVTAKATSDFYLFHSALDGVPYWDTGAPGLARMGDYLSRPADPFNEHEPVDSSAAAIAAQALLRLGHYLMSRNDHEGGRRYYHAGLTVADTLLDKPYLSTSPDHQGLLLHSVCFRPKAWDALPTGHRVPCGESSMWGDYHFRELCLLIGRAAHGGPYPKFYLEPSAS